MILIWTGSGEGVRGSESSELLGVVRECSVVHGRGGVQGPTMEVAGIDWGWYPVRF